MAFLLYSLINSICFFTNSRQLTEKIINKAMKIKDIVFFTRKAPSDHSRSFSQTIPRQASRI